MTAHLITAADLKAWRGRGPQGDLPTLARDLVWTTAAQLTHISFPGGDSVYRPGFDGISIAETATAFVPQGKTVWEIGTDKEPKPKAEKDYRKRLKESDPKTTFIFVTPREFSGKAEWAKAKHKEAKWKDVKVYDADDLEAWLSTSHAVSALWVERITHIPPAKILPTLLFWKEWESAVGGMLSPQLVTAGFERTSKRHSLWKWIDSSEPNILRLKAYSPQDGHLFLAAGLLFGDGYGDWLIRSVFVEEESTLRQLAASQTPHLIITTNDNVGIANSALSQGHRYCILTPYSASPTHKENSVISLPLRVSEFEAQKALEKLGMSSHTAQQSLRKSGRMLMALRRELSDEHPCWASPEAKEIMSSIALASGWNETLEEDRAALESLSAKSYAEIESSLRRIRATPMSPIQYIEPYWKILSPMDAWRCLGPQLTKSDFERFRAVLLAAFTAPDPTMELTPENRWAAAIYDKRTPYSQFIRSGLLQSLIIIAVFGDTFDLTGITHPQGWVDQLTQDIFKTCKDDDKWEALVPYLPELAEAAPTAFLNELESRTKSAPQSLELLLADRGNPMFSSSPHVYLVWALERLAWFPKYLARSAALLCELDRLDPGGNVGPRPLSALKNPFCAYRPQTMTMPDQRREVLSTLQEAYPETVQKLLLSLLPRYGGPVGNSPTPHWREVRYKGPKLWGEVFEEILWILHTLIQHYGNDGNVWAEIMEKYKWLQADVRAQIREELLNRSRSNTLTDQSRLREKLRSFLCHARSYPKHSPPEEELASFDTIFSNLEPEDLVQKHAWLFDYRPQFISGKKDLTTEEYQHVSADLQASAIQEFMKEDQAIKMICELAKTVKTPGRVGQALGEIAREGDWEPVFLNTNFEDTNSARSCEAFILTMGKRFGDDWIFEVIERSQALSASYLFLSFCCETISTRRKRWEMAEGLGEDCERHLWRNTSAFDLFSDKIPHEDQEIAFDKMIFYKCFRQLFDASAFKEKTLTYKQRVTILKAFLKSQEAINDIDYYDIQETFRIIREHPDRIDSEVITLEWAYAPLFRGEETQLLIHKNLARDPTLLKDFMEILFGGGEASTPQNAENAFHIFHNWQCIPGTRPDGTIDEKALTGWIGDARAIARDYEKVEYIETVIGEILAHAPGDADGLFPCEPVRNVLENVTTPAMASSLSAGIRNKRGTTMRSPNEGGEQERNLAKQFDGWADRLQAKWPKVAKILSEVASYYEHQAKWEDRRVQHGDMR